MEQITGESVKERKKIPKQIIRQHPFKCVLMFDSFTWARDKLSKQEKKKNYYQPVKRHSGLCHQWKT